jgi:hypothetical protein
VLLLQFEMFVIKRDGRKEEVHFDKVTARIKKLCYGLDRRFIDPVSGGYVNRIDVSQLRRGGAWTCHGLAGAGCGCYESGPRNIQRCYDTGVGPAGRRNMSVMAFINRHTFNRLT